MKKKFKTIINDTALLFDKIYVSAGKVGMNLDINPNERLLAMERELNSAEDYFKSVMAQKS